MKIFATFHTQGFKTNLFFLKFKIYIFAKRGGFLVIKNINFRFWGGFKFWGVLVFPPFFLEKTRV
jgi:hypothetical protein